jgi:hypothetical protein
MVLDKFLFTMTLPPDADLLPLLRAVSGHMARYLGLPEDEARQARDVLHHVVADRLAQLGGGAEPINVTFERPHTAGTVTVVVRSSAVPDDPPPASAPGIGPLRDDGHSRIRLSWRVHDAGQ